MPHKKLQIALEFMILYSFILVLFLFLFALISAQRAQTLNSQIFSQEQPIAQSIAMQLDRALQSGNGYNASFPIIGVIGTLNYQLIITQNGAVIINASVGKQTIQAIAYSSVKNVVSNPSFLMPNTLYYLVPIANGTIKIQNVFGNVCVDYQCPILGGIASNVSLSMQVVHAVTMNGGSSFISIPASNSLNSPANTHKITMEATVKLNSLTSEIFEYGYNGVYGLEVGPIESETSPQPGNFIATVGNTVADIVDCNAPFQLKTNVWYQLVATYDGSTVIDYVNGKQYCTKSVAASFYPSTTPLTFAEVQPGDVETENDIIADVQIYNTTLSASQVQSLYQGGIGGLPLNTNTLVAWWPLNGNANDYSGNGNNAKTFNGPLIYKTVVQISAKVTDMFGRPVVNVLVGFTTTLGNLTTNTGIAGQTATNYTNSNGIAIAFLNQQGTNGQASVSATVFNGNHAYQSSLLGWWPMNTGQSNTMYDLSGNGNNGAMKGVAYWAMPDYVSGFDGTSSYVATPYLQNSVVAYTLSAWIKTTSSSGVIIQNRLANSGNSLTLGFGPAGCGTQSSGQAYFCDDSNGMDIGVNSVPLVNDGKWHMLSGTWSAPSGTAISPSQFSIYIDGQPTNTLGFSVGSGKSPLTGAGGAIIGFHPVWNEYFSGSMSNVQVYNAILSQSQLQSFYQQGIAGPPLSGNIVGWWPLNGDANDYSGYLNNGTIFGNLNQLSTSSIPNINNNATGFLSASFNGMSVISLPNGIPSSILSSNARTITAWVYPTSRSSKVGLIYMGPSGGGLTANSFRFLIATSGNLALDVSNGYQASTLTVPLGAWSFVEAIWTGSSYYVCLSTSCQPLSPLPSQKLQQGLFYIGYEQPNNYHFVGNITNVQIYNITLSNQQILRLYQEGVSGLPLSASLAGWYPLNGNANDYSRNGNNGTTTNVIYVQQQAATPYLLSSPGGYGVNFNGPYNYVLSSFTLGSTFTVSFWLRKGGYSYTCESVIGKPSNSIQMEIYSPTQNGCNSGSEQNTQLVFAYVDSGGNANNGLGTVSLLPALVWEHAALTFNSISGTLKWYVNGVNTKTYTSLNSININYNPLNIGSGSSFFNGTIANVQFYSIDLSAAQINQLYQNAMPTSTSTVIPMSWIP
jgi:hypothetical protein